MALIWISSRAEYQIIGKGHIIKSILNETLSFGLFGIIGNLNEWYYHDIGLGY